MPKNLKHQMVVENKTKTDNNEHNKHRDHKQTQGSHHHHQKQQQQNPSVSYHVSLQYDPQIPEAGKPAKLSVYITEQPSGDTIHEFETIHDKLMHLIIVGEDLSYFAHIHPTLKVSKNAFTIFHTFPEAGKYKIWIDFKPKNGSQTIVAFNSNATGKPIHKPIPITNDKQYSKEIARKYQITLTRPKEIRANSDVEIAFSISNISGRPITDLEPLMGAGGHSVIISDDVKEFLHVHPSEEVDATWRGGPAVRFKTRFPNPGPYKVWGQFQHQGRTITPDFVLDVT
jgi:hypothetical protein